MVCALHARDDRIVVAGLMAYAMLHRASAGTMLLAYARNRDPVVRAGVFEALSSRGVIDQTNSTLFAMGLADRALRVRSAALEELHLPRRADWRNAREQLSAFRTFRPLT